MSEEQSSHAAGRYLAFDIGGTKIATGIVTLAAEPTVEHQHAIATEPSKGGDDIAHRLLQLAQEQLSLAAREGIALAGIGIGSAGVVDSEQGSILSATDLIPGWAGQRLGDMFKMLSDLPFYMIGDVSAHGMGEALYGAGRGYESVLSVGVGTGIGGAYIAHGHLMTGAHHVAGHIGHMAHGLGAGVLCSCGTMSGHIEPVASGTGLATLYNLMKSPDALAVESGQQVSALAQEGDAFALEVLRRSARALGEVIASACNMLDPAAVVLSGSVVQAGDAWWQALRDGFTDSALAAVKATPLLRSELGGNAPLVGAAAAVASHYLHL